MISVHRVERTDRILVHSASSRWLKPARAASAAGVGAVGCDWRHGGLLPGGPGWPVRRSALAPDRRPVAWLAAPNSTLSAVSSMYASSSEASRG